VGINPLFVVQINYPGHLSAEIRSVVSSAVRELGGLMLFYSELYTLQRQSTREVTFEHLRAVLFPEAIIRNIAHELLGTLPGAVVAPLRNALEKANRTRSESCVIPTAQVTNAIQAADKAMNRLKDVKRQIQGGFGESIRIDVRDAI